MTIPHSERGGVPMPNPEDAPKASGRKAAAPPVLVREPKLVDSRIRDAVSQAISGNEEQPSPPQLGDGEQSPKVPALRPQAPMTASIAAAQDLNGQRPVIQFLSETVSSSEDLPAAQEESHEEAPRLRIVPPVDGPDIQFLDGDAGEISNAHPKSIASHTSTTGVKPDTGLDTTAFPDERGQGRRQADLEEHAPHAERILLHAVDLEPSVAVSVKEESPKHDASSQPQAEKNVTSAQHSDESTNGTSSDHLASADRETADAQRAETIAIPILEADPRTDGNGTHHEDTLPTKASHTAQEADVADALPKRLSLRSSVAQLKQHRFAPKPESLEGMVRLRTAFEQLQQEFPFLSGIGYFGSRTKGTDHALSDTDICIFYDSSTFGDIDPQTAELQWKKIRYTLGQSLGYGGGQLDERINHASGGLIVDISKEKTGEDLQTFISAVELFIDLERPTNDFWRAVDIDATRNLMSRFFLSAGSDVYASRYEILETFKNLPDGEAYFRILMNLLGNFERPRDAKIPVPSFDGLPTSIDEAERYFNIRPTYHAIEKIPDKKADVYMIRKDEAGEANSHVPEEKMGDVVFDTTDVLL